MDPVPRMVIPTSLARRKGEIEVSTPEEIDQLISELIIAKTGLAGAASAIGAQADEAAREVVIEAMMDGARRVEAERADDLVAWCDYLSHDGRRCVRVAHRPNGMCLDDQGRVLHYGDPCLCCTGLESDDCSCREDCGVTQCQAADPGPAEPEPAPEAVAALRARRERMAELGAHVRELSQPAPTGPALTVVVGGEPAAAPCPHRHPVSGQPCIGLAGHVPPCRPLFGDEWVPPSGGGVLFPVGCDPDHGLTAVTP